MKAMLGVGAAFVAAGLAVLVAVHGEIRFAGVLLVLWGVGTVPTALRLRDGAKHR